MKDIQDWLGLSSYATTANIYAHLDTDSKKQPATKMNQTVSITPGISAAIQAGGENSGREPGFKKKILRFSIHALTPYRSARRRIRRAQRLWVLYSFIRPPSSLAETRLPLPVSQFRIARASA